MGVLFEPNPNPNPDPNPGPPDGVELQKLLDGIHSHWKRGRLKYDIRHFMANFSMIVAAQKDSPTYGKFMAYVSAAIFKILPGEWLLTHASKSSVALTYLLAVYTNCLH